MPSPNLRNPHLPLGDRLEAFDKELMAQVQLGRKELLFKLASLGLKQQASLAGEVSLRKSLRATKRRKNGELERVGYSFERKGIFMEHGVGKYRKKGSSAAAKAAQPWLAEVLPVIVERLADFIEEGYADIIAAELAINIPGVYSTKVSGG